MYTTATTATTRTTATALTTATTHTTATTLTTATTHTTLTRATTLTTLTRGTWGHTFAPRGRTWHWCLRTFHGVIHELLTVPPVLVAADQLLMSTPNLPQVGIFI